MRLSEDTNSDFVSILFQFWRRGVLVIAANSIASGDCLLTLRYCQAVLGADRLHLSEPPNRGEAIGNHHRLWPSFPPNMGNRSSSSSRFAPPMLY